MISKRAFTFIEIIVVVSIMAVVSVSSVFYFDRFIQSQTTKSVITSFSSEIDFLDSQIQQGKIYDYEISLGVGKFFTYSFDNYKKERAYFFNTDYSSWRIDLKTNITNPSTGWSLRIYGNEKIQEIKDIKAIDTTNTLLKYKKNTFTSSFSWSTWNTLVSEYYSQDNLFLGEEKNITLSSINTQQDKLGQSFTWIILKNKDSKKEIFWSGTKLETVFLFFKRGEFETYLEINAWK